ncbi:28531_t:CDS:2, partial [Racocetra persica]
ENAVNQFDYIINNNDTMNNNNSLDNLYINNSSSFNDLSSNDQDTGAGVHFAPNPYTYSPIYQSLKIVPHNLPSMSSTSTNILFISTSTNILPMSSSSSTHKDKQLSVKLDDLSPFNFEGLPEETIPSDLQVQQVLYYFNHLVKAIEKGQSQSSKETFLVQILVFKGEEQDSIYWLNEFATASHSWWRTVANKVQFWNNNLKPAQSFGYLNYYSSSFYHLGNTISVNNQSNNEVSQAVQAILNYFKQQPQQKSNTPQNNNNNNYRNNNNNNCNNNNNNQNNSSFQQNTI